MEEIRDTTSLVAQQGEGLDQFVSDTVPPRLEKAETYQISKSCCLMVTAVLATIVILAALASCNGEVQSLDELGTSALMYSDCFPSIDSLRD